jgi:hypothetical protein
VLDSHTSDRTVFSDFWNSNKCESSSSTPAILNVVIGIAALDIARQKAQLI